MSRPLVVGGREVYMSSSDATVPVAEGEAPEDCRSSLLAACSDAAGACGIDLSAPSPHCQIKNGATVFSCSVNEVTAGLLVVVVDSASRRERGSTSSSISPTRS